MNDPLIGKQLANFRIDRLLGQGGMAQVYYGWDIKLNRPVAIKVINVSDQDNSNFAERFLNEGRLMANWRHENIVQIYYADDEKEFYYYVMEYIDGQNLGSVIASYNDKNKLMPFKEALRIGRAIAGALDYAHSQGVIHRDVKPANVLISKNGRVVLTDFGLAMELDKKSLGEVFGTPHYISPEQAKRSADAVPQSDLYSFGVILYEMLAGTVPFDDPSPTSVALQHIIQAPPLPHSINPKLSHEVDKVLLKALEKSPHNRYKSGAELMDALERALSLPATSKARAVPLPPPPVGMPTIVHRSFKKKGIDKKNQNKDSHSKSQPRQSRFMWLIIGLLILWGLFFVWMYDAGRFNYLSISRVPVSSGTPARKTATVINSTNMNAFLAESTLTPISSPTTIYTPSASAELSVYSTFTSIPTITATSTLPVEPSVTETLQTSTFTAAGIETSTPLVSATSPVTPVIALSQTSLPAPTAKPLSLNHFILYYDNNSFYLYSGASVNRTLSAFSFQRKDDQGSPLADFFGGWLWTDYYPRDVISPKSCATIEIYDSPPYLDPPACGSRQYLSIVSPSRTSGKIFWSAQSNSDNFLVLWKGQSVAQCRIAANVCDVYIP